MLGHIIIAKLLALYNLRKKSRKNWLFVHKMLNIGYWHVIGWLRIRLTLCVNVVQ